MHQISTINDSDRYRETCRSLDEYELVMLDELEQDIAEAHKALKPILSIFKPRRGQVKFAVLPPNSPLAAELKRCNYHVSTLTLDSEMITEERLGMLLATLRLKTKVRCNGLQANSATVDGQEFTYFTYHIDMEAA
jgi:hypothetical protein